MPGVAVARQWGESQRDMGVRPTGGILVLLKPFSV